jgi:hypothetical protein
MNKTVRNLFAKVIRYLKFLFPLTYRVTHVREDGIYFCVYKQWLWFVYNVDDVLVTEQ